MPPETDGNNKQEQELLLKMAVQEKHSVNEIKELTKITVLIPMKVEELCHSIKNWAGVTG